MEEFDFSVLIRPTPDDVPLDDDTDFGQDGVLDWFERMGRLRDSKGVAWIRKGNEAHLTMLRYKDVRKAFLNPEVFSKAKYTRPATFPFMGPNIQGYEGAEHRRQRALVLPAFAKKAVPKYVEPMFRPIAEELVDEFQHLGETDLVTSFARKYPLRITAQLLGIPPQQEEWLEACALNMLAYPDMEKVAKANQDFADFILPVFEERRAKPGNDLISKLQNAEVDGVRLTEEEILGFIRLLFPAGVDTTWLSLGSMMLAVAQHPEVHDRLINNAEDRKWAVEETLRWSSATSAEPRITEKDVVVAGIKIPAGQIINLSTATANRDPSVFPNPDEWDLDRRPTDHIAFGVGAHLCLGAFLARGELTVALEVLMKRLPNLRLAEPAYITGSLLRGPRKLIVKWDA